MPANVDLILERAHAERRRSNWFGAQKLYEAAAGAVPGNPHIHHNIALCLYARGDYCSAFEHVEIATRRASDLVQAWVLRARIERRLGEMEAAERSLLTALDVKPHQPDALIDLANLAINEFGDARAAQRLVRPLLGDPEYDEDAQLATLMAKLYDRDESAEELTKKIRAFSSKYLRLPNFRFTAGRKPKPAGSKTKQRVGLLSPFFHVSPVYFFAFGSLSLLADEVDFVVFNRGTEKDQATGKFRSIAREWHDVAHYPAEQLANHIYAENLDALIDLGGWMDAIGLKALSTKPARRMYKWVGGQACTTGLTVFDGFFSDVNQTPAACVHLYSEPLVLFEGGYVSYMPPDYMPEATMKRGECFGVVSNPVKISAAYLEHLRARAGMLLARGGTLRFIDRRYRHARCRERILAGLCGHNRESVPPASIEFAVPKNHREFLVEVSRLTGVLDTRPYSAGLTATEALTLKIPCETDADGQLFSERHCFSHQQRWSDQNVAEATRGCEERVGGASAASARLAEQILGEISRLPAGLSASRRQRYANAITTR